MLDNSTEVVAAPDFLNQGRAESTNFFLKLLLMLVSSLLQNKDDLFDEARLFPTVCN